MKQLIFLILLAISVSAYPLDIRVVPNTPLFDDYECHNYTNTEAVRAVLQLLASARITLEVSSFSLDNEPVRKLIKSKANSGVSVTVYSPNDSALDKLSSSYNISLHREDTSRFKTPTIIRVDNSFVGMGNIDLEETLKVRSGFFVCRSNDTNDTKEVMEKHFSARIIKSTLRDVRNDRY